MTKKIETKEEKEQRIAQYRKEKEEAAREILLTSSCFNKVSALTPKLIDEQQHCDFSAWLQHELIRKQEQLFIDVKWNTHKKSTIYSINYLDIEFLKTLCNSTLNSYVMAFLSNDKTTLTMFYSKDILDMIEKLSIKLNKSKIDGDQPYYSIDIKTLGKKYQSIGTFEKEF